ncbi:MAG: hypothetical protein WDM77_15510 [Steroidobacteraceae bacterium]
MARGFAGFNFNLLFWSFLAMFADGYDISVMPFAMPTLSKLWNVDAGLVGVALTASWSAYWRAHRSWVRSATAMAAKWPFC